MKTDNFQTSLCESVSSVFTAVVLAVFLNFYFVFLGFVLFQGTPTVLGTW